MPARGIKSPLLADVFTQKRKKRDGKPFCVYIIGCAFLGKLHEEVFTLHVCLHESIESASGLGMEAVLEPSCRRR